MRYKLIYLLFSILCSSLLFTSVVDAQHIANPKTIKVIEPAQLPWQTFSTLPQGAKAAILGGNPAKPGAFAISVRLPKGFRGKPHYHPYDACILVISGKLWIGTGKTFDKTKLKPISRGQFFIIPARTPHFERTKRKTILLVIAKGPWFTKYPQAKNSS